MPDHDLFIVSQAWKERFPGASIGILAMKNVRNPSHHYRLEPVKAAMEADLRERFSEQDREDLRKHRTLSAYREFYKGFRKTYHVLLQLESVVHKGRQISGGPGLVEAMFMAELSNLLLTAGHDLDTVEPPMGVRIADGSERYIRINGQEQELKAGDMYIADQGGVMSSVIYGPDLRTQIQPNTRRVIYTTYAMPGIDPDTVYDHMADIEDLVRLFSPRARVEHLEVYPVE